MAPVDDSSTKQSANGSLAITFLLSCLRLQSEDSTVKQSQHSTVCARPGGHNGHHVALDNLWPSHGRHRVRDFHCRGTEDTEEDCAEKRRRIQEPGASRRRRPRNMASNTPTVLKGQKNLILCNGFEGLFRLFPAGQPSHQPTTLKTLPSASPELRSLLLEYFHSDWSNGASVRP